MKAKPIICLFIIALSFGLFLISCKKESSAPPPVINNKVPVCNITSPLNNASFNTTDSVLVTVAASDTDGTVSKVELYIDNTINGSPKTATPYQFIIASNTLATGNHTLKAVATDNKGAIAESSISIVVNYVPTVYVGGYEFNGAVPIAKYWKNNTPVALTNGTSAANIYSLFVTGNDIYAAGYEFQSNTSIAKYWKNGTAVTLGTDASEAKSIFADSNNNVYVGGWEIIGGFDLPRYWNNGTGTTVNVFDPIISQVVTGNGSCNGVYASGNTVHAVGSYRNSQGRFSPWDMTNGIVPAATIPNNDKHCFANAVFVAGNDVYVAGTQNNPTTGLPMATYWKNGIPVELTTGATTDGIATSVFVVGNDVYVAGYETPHFTNFISTAKYWKNGVEIKLSDGTKNAFAKSIYVYGSDVYVGGSEDQPGNQSIAKYWKNGTSINLTNGTYKAEANSIVVK